MDPATRMIVLDDDPTGIQTVHGCLLLTRWDAATMAAAFADACPFFFVLTNTRAYDGAEARRIVAAVMDAVLAAGAPAGGPLVMVSRSDSTLRSHFPIEIDTIVGALAGAGTPPDAVFHVPAFIEAGRVTAGDEHFVIDGVRRVPASQTEYARDAVFGYATSHLPSWIERKTGGAVRAEQVRSIPLEMLRAADASPLAAFLDGLAGGVYVVVNAETYDDLACFARGVRAALAAGKRFAFQAAASVVKALAGIPDRPLVGPELVRGGGPGLVVVGSHVDRTTRQLAALLAEQGVEGIEADVRAILDDAPAALEAVRRRVEAVAHQGRTPCVYTSRRELRFSSASSRLAAGREVSRFLVRVTASVGYHPAWLLAKGGITSHDVLVEAAGVRMARVAGQILPGVPVVVTPADSRFGSIPLVIFPGNVGDDEAVRRAYRILQGDRP
ncbi:MAG: four-carbon acid sugar kinase family protein [Planctomycetes bacterium]|nr:four-carbon acid sugar kinase family protein [Planctomycetota bacterium]